MTKRYWKFYAERDDDDGFYMGEEDIFIGTDDEAVNEANRRSDKYENETGRTIDNVIMESRGIVIN
ncbi:MAG: hypothetical protein WC979_09490 [Candidatus Pacearchaeota archaeon]|jgi:hypothetical protein